MPSNELLIEIHYVCRVDSTEDNICRRNNLVEAVTLIVQGGSNMTGTDLYVNKPHCAAAVRP